MGSLDMTVTEEVENVRVAVRVRPLNARETSMGYRQIATVDCDNNTIQVAKLACKTDLPKMFKFDHVFDESRSQMDVYCFTACPIVEKVLEGYNGTIFAYGQTGTGKTFTMAGELDDNNNKGIIPNAFAHIFGNIARAPEDVAFLVRVTYMEIYNEEVRDLLAKDPNASLEVRERPDIGVFVKDLSGYVVNTVEDMEKIMAVGDKNRAVGATLMNDRSSRSHAIFTITIESSSSEGGERRVRVGKLHLVDLAGSERQSKTHATGQRLKEATKINQSLSVLGNVISALVDGKSTHIPYRNSKLTRLLQDSLGGNSKTVMIATVGPSENDYEETVSTLRYANRAKNIKNRTHVNREPKDALLLHFQQEIEELKRQLAETETGADAGDSTTDTAERRERRKKLKKTAERPPEDPEKSEELNRTLHEQEKLREKLQNLENKILVGGENLLEKALNTESMLEVSAKALEQQKRNEEELEQSLQKIEAEKIDIGERYSTLQDEAVGKTKKLKKVVQLLASAKAELADQQREQQREMEGINDNLRALTRELQLAELLLNSYIPAEYQTMIERYTHWNEDIGEWQLKCVAYTGNNMRKQLMDSQSPSKASQSVGRSTRNVYLNYESEKDGDLQQQQQPISKMRASSVPRPTTRRSR